MKARYSLPGTQRLSGAISFRNLTFQSSLCDQLEDHIPASCMLDGHLALITWVDLPKRVVCFEQTTHFVRELSVNSIPRLTGYWIGRKDRARSVRRHGLMVAARQDTSHW